MSELKKKFEELARGVTSFSDVTALIAEAAEVVSTAENIIGTCLNLTLLTPKDFEQMARSKKWAVIVASNPTLGAEQADALVRLHRLERVASAQLPARTVDNSSFTVGFEVLSALLKRGLLGPEHTVSRILIERVTRSGRKSEELALALLRAAWVTENQMEMLAELTLHAIKRADQEMDRVFLPDELMVHPKATHDMIKRLVHAMIATHAPTDAYRRLQERYQQIGAREWPLWRRDVIDLAVASSERVQVEDWLLCFEADNQAAPEDWRHAVLTLSRIKHEDWEYAVELIPEDVWPMLARTDWAPFLANESARVRQFAAARMSEQSRAGHTEMRQADTPAPTPAPGSAVKKKRLRI